MIRPLPEKSMFHVSRRYLLCLLLLFLTKFKEKKHTVFFSHKDNVGFIFSMFISIFLVSIMLQMQDIGTQNEIYSFFSYYTNYFHRLYKKNPLFCTGPPSL
jgi:hypothetical protein